MCLLFHPGGKKLSAFILDQKGGYLFQSGYREVGEFFSRYRSKELLPVCIHAVKVGDTLHKTGLRSLDEV